MARDDGYREAEKKIEAARRLGARALDLQDLGLTELPGSLWQLTQLLELYLDNNNLPGLPESLRRLTKLTRLDADNNQLTELPESLGQLTQLKTLFLQRNQLTALPESLGQLTQLQSLYLQKNQLAVLPESLGQLKELWTLDLQSNQLTELPESPGQLAQLQTLDLVNNQLTALPESLGQLPQLQVLDLAGNPLNPDLAAAYQEGGVQAVLAYLRKAADGVVLREAKLIIVGEGEVGKTCLMDALEGKPWREHDTTHGIEIRSIPVVDSDSGTKITLNGWDFGGQRVYRPTHQLFFTSPAVYLVAWKPREGSQQGRVKEWIKLVKHREPEAKILVVATHGGPKQRQPDIDRQELWDQFGKDTIVDFFHVDSKPAKGPNGERRGIEALKEAIARVAAELPEMKRSVPRAWRDARNTLKEAKAAYLSRRKVLDLCRKKHQMDEEDALLFLAVSRRLGHLIHYEHDPVLQDIVVLKPDWLATAVSFVLDDKATRNGHGLVSSSRLNRLWNDPARKKEERYPEDLQKIFVRLMERFDLSYKVAGVPSRGEANSTSLIAQLVPDNRPQEDLEREWPGDVEPGDGEQVQICRIVDAAGGRPAEAEGLFYQLIVRLHKYSLGRADHNMSVHWQRGLILADDYNGRALLEHIGGDLRITVRAAYPDQFLAMLTGEVRYLVESFWEGLHCDVMVPCIDPCGKNEPGAGLYEVGKLIDSKRKMRPDYPCPVCNEWQDIDSLLRNAPAARPAAAETLLAEYTQVRRDLAVIRKLIVGYGGEARDRFDRLDANDQALLSKVDVAFNGMMTALTDEAKEGPRLFSLTPIERSNFNPKKWAKAEFQLTLWCEHSRVPLPHLNGPGDEKGVYELELTRKWFKQAAPFLKVMAGTLGLVLPVASSGLKLAVDDAAYKAFEKQFDFGKSVIDASLKGTEKVVDWLDGDDPTGLEEGKGVHAKGATLREVQVLLKQRDVGFGGLVRVINKRGEFLWVHPRFESEY